MKRLNVFIKVLLSFFVVLGFLCFYPKTTSAIIICSLVIWGIIDLLLNITDSIIKHDNK